MNVLKYLESKGIKDNPRIIDVSGQVTDFYLQTLLEDFKKQLLLHIVSSSSKPEPPKPPLTRTIRNGVGRFCKNCNSTMSKYGFLRLFGKMYCDNKKCPNSKLEKNYY